MLELGLEPHRQAQELSIQELQRQALELRKLELELEPHRQALERSIQEPHKLALELRMLELGLEPHRLEQELHKLAQSRQDTG